MKKITVKKTSMDKYTKIEEEKINWLIYNLSKRYSIEAIKQTLNTITNKVN